MGAWRVAGGGWRVAGHRVSARSGPGPRTTDQCRGQQRTAARSASRSLRQFAGCVALLALAGCSSVEPWVKPYERAAFADPIMSMDPNPVSSSYIHHVYEAREGARGASGSAGGGCGCN
jgi:hypothetical protein